MKIMDKEELLSTVGGAGVAVPVILGIIGVTKGCSCSVKRKTTVDDKGKKSTETKVKISGPGSEPEKEIRKIKK